MPKANPGQSSVTRATASPATMTSRNPGSRIAAISAILDRNQTQVEDALQGRIPAGQFVQIALTSMWTDPAILACSDASIWLALMHTAQLGLVPSGIGGAYLVPYGKTCQMVISYQGYIELALRGGVRKIEASVVYEGDDFEIRRGTDPYVRHVPDFDAVHDDGSLLGVRGAYAVAWLPGDLQIAEPMRLDQITRIRDLTRGGAVWKTHPVEMARKTAVRRLFKYLPKTGELVNAMAAESAVDATGALPALPEFEMEQGPDGPTGHGERTASVREHLAANGRGEAEEPQDAPPAPADDDAEQASFDEQGE